jgi:hypothetical protein
MIRHSEKLVVKNESFGSIVLLGQQALFRDGLSSNVNNRGKLVEKDCLDECIK